MRVAFTDVDGIRTRYFYEGSGPTLVLIHGLGISADSWTRNIDALAEHFTVYAPDMIGHGFTGFAGLARAGASSPPSSPPPSPRRTPTARRSSGARSPTSSGPRCPSWQFSWTKPSTTSSPT